MNCLACGYENRETARYCGACAEALPQERACPECKTTNPAGQRFCDRCARPLLEEATSAPRPQRTLDGRKPRAYTPKHLAEKILVSRSALEGERKQVTVLFADVKGSAELTGGLDPEDLHGVMDGFFAILNEGIHRFEGTINQYTGDGVMALFGAPLAHEDHAARAL